MRILNYLGADKQEKVSKEETTVQTLAPSFLQMELLPVDRATGT
jgi:hypothetical protein